MPLWNFKGGDFEPVESSSCMKSMGRGLAARLNDPCDGGSWPSCVVCGCQFYVVLYRSSSHPQSSVSFHKNRDLSQKQSPKRASIPWSAKTSKTQMPLVRAPCRMPHSHSSFLLMQPFREEIERFASCPLHYTTTPAVIDAQHQFDASVAGSPLASKCEICSRSFSGK